MSPSKWLMVVMATYFGSFSSCSSDKIDAVTLTAKQTQTVDLALNQEKVFVLAMSGDTKRTTSIKFIKVAEGRCPAESCSACYATYVFATLLVKTENASDTLRLHRIGCINPTDLKPGDALYEQWPVQTVQIGLSNISEFTNAKPINPYVVKLLVTPL